MKTIQLNSLSFGDCLELLPYVKSESVDMVLCDLPYGTTACKWDNIISPEKLWPQYERIVKPNGVIVLTASQPFATFLIQSNFILFKYEWIWVKNNKTGFPHAKNMPLKGHENILVFSKGSMGHAALLGERRMPYYPQGLIRIDQQFKNTPNKWGNIAGHRPSHKAAYLKEFKNYPSSVLYYSIERGLHPTQKPVPLFEFLIRSYTDIGGTVLDNCAGSGTTGIACLNSVRNFILMESDPGIYETAKARLKQHELAAGLIFY